MAGKGSLIMKNELVVLKNGKMMVTSLEMVEQINFFREQEERVLLRHDTLLEIIRDEFSDEISLQELLESKRKTSRGKTYPMFEMTPLQAKQLLARESKYVRKAMLLHIERLENFIREKMSADWQQARALGKLTRRSQTDIIMDKLIPLAEAQGSRNAGKLYMTYTKLVNATLGIEAGQRDKLSADYIETIRFLERAIENIISQECDNGTHYKEIYQICKVKCGILKDLAFLPKVELLEVG